MSAENCLAIFSLRNFTKLMLYQNAVVAIKSLSSKWLLWLCHYNILICWMAMLKYKYLHMWYVRLPVWWNSKVQPLNFYRSTSLDLPHPQKSAHQLEDLRLHACVAVSSSYPIISVVRIMTSYRQCKTLSTNTSNENQHEQVDKKLWK